jgi:hypothetical protein
MSATGSTTSAPASRARPIWRAASRCHDSQSQAMTEALMTGQSQRSPSAVEIYPLQKTCNARLRKGTPAA